MGREGNETGLKARFLIGFIANNRTAATIRASQPPLVLARLSRPMLNSDRALRKGPITWLLAFTYESPVNCIPIRDLRFSEHLLFIYAWHKAVCFMPE